MICVYLTQNKFKWSREHFWNSFLLSYNQFNQHFLALALFLLWLYLRPFNIIFSQWRHIDLGKVCVCRIKTGHSNLVSCFGPRMRALAKVFYRGESRGKIPCQRPNPRAKTWHKIWMTGLNPNYDTTPIPSLQDSQNKCQKSSFTYDHRRHLILPLPPVCALPTVNAPTCCQGALIDDVTISYCRSHGQFESLVNASCQRIILWIIRTPIMHID